MKIIGETADGLLLSATRNEVANLIGAYYCDRETAEKIKVGTKIEVSDMYQTLHRMKGMKKELDDAAAKLRIAADTIQLTSPVVEAPQKQEGQQ